MNWPEPNMQPVEVTWIDAIAGHGWRRTQEWDEWLEVPGAMQRSCGFLYRIQDEWVAIAQNKEATGMGSIGEMMQIPMAIVISIRELTDG